MYTDKVSSVDTNNIARFAVTPEFLVGIMKHGLDAARIVEHPLPDDATFKFAFVDAGLVWIVVASDAFSQVEHGAIIPELPRTAFTKISNKYLVEAAPKLLSACKKLMEHMYSEFGLSGDRWATSVKADAEAAEAAIAEAEGR